MIILTKKNTNVAWFKATKFEDAVKELAHIPEEEIRRYYTKELGLEIPKKTENELKPIIKETGASAGSSVDTTNIGGSNSNNRTKPNKPTKKRIRK